MKKLVYILSIAAATVSSSCNNDFLDTDNLYEKSYENFYRTPKDIDEAMSGVYNALYVGNPHSNESIAANLLSDLMLGGGGPDDISAKNVDAFMDPAEDTYRDLWIETYNGATRANIIISKVAESDYSEFFESEQEAEQFKMQTLGEAYFMRAFFYFRAAKFFGGMPLITEVEGARDVARSSYTETFGQIASDLKMAIETMPAIPFSQIPTSQYGHANKWVAEAYMARVYLFYTGYMTNIEGQATSEIPLAGEAGGSITKANVLSYLEDCMNNSTYALADDFRNIWPYSYVNQSAGTTVLPWAENEGLEWVGQDGLSPTFGTGNPESMFVLRYSTTNWDWGQEYNNRTPLFFGIRDNSMVPFGQGWGWGPVNPKLWNSWDDADPRKKGSILQMWDAEQGTGGYQQDKGDHETGLFNKKYTTLQHDDPDGEDGVKGMFYFLYDMNNGDPLQLWAAQDFIYMRYADVLLMHSEISETADGMNAVRNRAGLSSIGYSLDAIKEERMHEFAFEGLRWFDLVRWGDVNNAFGDQINVRNSGVDAVYSVQYRPETKGLVPVPESEIRLSNGAYEQNPGW
ncbi:RagB/SusD family nutrient uptake outer membrane protein [Robertkochia solimangrovi]|uniref:RagB/SusD family nutrient uptake outer membrane protein n=1 Tax=Robertkochia solimangrovi TaxID=2213046 RepID=UPI00117ECD68|nr:RagB/SusD family nutrient uptake outer membrane protein [Robertkochia solimangrovi]TRZ45079.1 RagB/SusD family nutrient uptake outer membrane protein [Robertkochia solimangrovi]